MTPAECASFPDRHIRIGDAVLALKNRGLDGAWTSAADVVLL